MITKGMLKKYRTQKAFGIKIIIKKLFFWFFFDCMLIFQNFSVLKMLFAQVKVLNTPAAMMFLFRIFFYICNHSDSFPSYLYFCIFNVFHKRVGEGGGKDS